MSLQQKQAKIETFVDARRQRRHKLFLETEARGPQSSVGMVIVYDISDTGLLIETESRLKAGEMIEVSLPQAGLMEAEVMWVGGEIYGCRFTQELPRAVVGAARLSGHATRPNSGDVLETTFGAQPGGIAQTSMALAGELSVGARVWIIIGLALSLWIMIGATAYWVVA